MNASDGGLFIQTSLDRETQAQYLLVIAAYNLGAKAYNDTDRPVRGRVDGWLSGLLYSSLSLRC